MQHVVSCELFFSISFYNLCRLEFFLQTRNYFKSLTRTFSMFYDGLLLNLCISVYVCSSLVKITLLDILIDVHEVPYFPV